MKNWISLILLIALASFAIAQIDEETVPIEDLTETEIEEGVGYFCSGKCYDERGADECRDICETYAIYVCSPQCTDDHSGSWCRALCNGAEDWLENEDEEIRERRPIIIDDRPIIITRFVETSQKHLIV